LQQRRVLSVSSSSAPGQSASFRVSLSPPWPLYVVSLTSVRVPSGLALAMLRRRV
jgi:hypothetical protein